MTIEQPWPGRPPSPADFGAERMVQPPVEFPLDGVRGGSRHIWASVVLYGGAVTLVFGSYVLHATIFARQPYSFVDYANFGWAAVYSAFLLLALYALDPVRASKWWRAAILGAAGGAVAATSISVVQLVLGSSLLPRFVVFSAALAMAPLAVVARLVDGHGKTDGGTRLVACGRPEELWLLERDLRQHRGRAAAMVGSVTIDQVHAAPAALETAVRASAANAMILSSAALADDCVVDEAQRLHSHGVRARSFVQFYEQWLGKMPVAELERSSLLFDVSEVHAGFGRVKRVLDWVGAIPLGLLLMIAIPFVWVGNRFGNQGPLFYTQTRVGKNYAEFTIVKFRTMTPHNAPSTWTTVDDPRVTPFGRFLRRTHLDELPQVINVFRGELALVGPRPEQPSYVAELERDVPFYATRHIVRPGITGWAQVRYPYGSSTLDSLEKLQYDFYYIYNQGLALDILCLLRTLQSVGRGAR